jgi:NAD(P)-dependent dehydrogenase (short-subunit alcohol dehydrogenase family)
MRVNAVVPGATVADMLRSVLPAELEPDVAGRMAPRRLGTPDDIAQVVAFLASDDGRSRRDSGFFVQSPPGHPLRASGLLQVTDIVDPDDVFR